MRSEYAPSRMCRPRVPSASAPSFVPAHLQSHQTSHSRDDSSHVPTEVSEEDLVRQQQVEAYHFSSAGDGQAEVSQK
ncbi:MAG: hypothetical protein MHM6MM_006332 [Cercozoa sp. M6MM]